MRIHRDERGQTILLVALSLPLLLGFIGIATDVGALFKDKRTMQTAADAAAIAAALNYNSGTFSVAAQNAATANGFTNGSNGVVVTTLDGPTWPSSNYLGKAGYLEVTITKPESTIFLALFGHPSVTVKARAVASKIGPSAACVYAINTNAVNSVSVSDGAQVVSNQCGLVVDSSGSPPISVTGGPLTTLSMKSIGTVGDCNGSCGDGTISPFPLVSGIIPYSDPLSSLPQFTCNGGSCSNGTTTIPCVSDPKINGNGRVTLDPSCYNGLTIGGSGIVFFNPGTYVINGDMNFTGTNIFTGTGVTFYIGSGTINIGNNATINFNAPNDASNPYNGIVFAQSATTPQTINIVAGSLLAGILYFPNTQLTIHTTGAIGPNIWGGFVAQSLSFTTANPGNKITLSDYASLPNVVSPLSSVVLVE